MKHKPHTSKQISNRRARHDYELGDGFVVGVALTGAETKALRRGQGHLKGSYVTIKDNELWLVNATISGDCSVKVPEVDRTRNRKLLAKRRQIDELIAAKQQGNTIVPLELLTRGRYIKLRIAAGRGKKKYDKRQAIKLKDTRRANAAELKNLR
ncbi:MAG TPA: SsrA-binding protein SmpB [Candidatus Saccharimonadales bacterium]|nr:SsrA-binding protein SmpB [Candidatus Saccharimonadales bacterium]